MKHKRSAGFIGIRLLRFELWTLTSVVVFALGGAFLAFAGIKFLVESQAQWDVESCSQSCNTMSDGCYKNACLSGCSDPRQGCIDSCNCGVGDQTACVSQCENMDYSGMGGATGDGGGTTMGSDYCDEMISPSAGNTVVGYRKWGDDGGEIKYDINWNEVGRCEGGSMGGGNSMGMQNCTYDHAMMNNAPVTEMVWCESDYYNCHMGDANGEAIGNDGLSLGAPNYCESWGNMGEGCSPGIPGYADAYSMNSVPCSPSVSSGGSSSAAPAQSSSSDDGIPDIPVFLDQKEKELSEFVGSLSEIDSGDSACMLQKIGDISVWKDYMHLYKDAREKWFSEMNRRFGVDLAEFNALPACPDSVQEDVGTSASCADIERKCVLMGNSVFAKEGEEAFLEMVQRCMDNKSSHFGVECEFSGDMSNVRAKDTFGKTCGNDGDCGDGWICNTWDFHERPPRKNSAIQAKVVKDVFLGRCEQVPDGKCLYDSHCAGDSVCSDTNACVKPPCWQECVAGGVEVVGTAAKHKKDCRAFTREDIAAKLNLSSPSEIAKAYKREVESLGVTVEEFERCEELSRVKNGAESGESTAEQQSNTEESSSKIGEVFGRAVAMLLNLTQNSAKIGLNSDTIGLIKDAMLWFGGAIGDIAVDQGGGKAGQLVVEARNWISRIKDNMHASDVHVSEENNAGELNMPDPEAITEVQLHLQEADRMLREGGAIDQVLVGLESRGYSDPSWNEYLNEARALFYGGSGEHGSVESKCKDLLGKLYDGADVDDSMVDACFGGMKKVFNFLEENMKPAVESVVPDDVMAAVTGGIEGLQGDGEHEVASGVSAGQSENTVHGAPQNCGDECPYAPAYAGGNSGTGGLAAAASGQSGGWAAGAGTGTNANTGGAGSGMPYGNWDQCVYKAKKVDLKTAMLLDDLGEYVKEDRDAWNSMDHNNGDMMNGTPYIGVDTGTKYANGEIDVNYMWCDCNGDGNNDCGGWNNGGDMGANMACINRGVKIRATGAPVGEDIECGGADTGCTGVSSGKIYAPSALDWMDMECDCPRWENGSQQPRDGVFDDCGGYMDSSSGSYSGSGSSDANAGQTEQTGGGQTSTPVWGACFAIGREVIRAHADPLNAYPAPPSPNTGPYDYDAPGYSQKSVYENDFRELAGACQTHFEELKDRYCSQNSDVFYFKMVEGDPFSPDKWRDEQCVDGCVDHECPIQTTGSGSSAMRIPTRSIIDAFLRIVAGR